jgi:hypothetical protein
MARKAAALFAATLEGDRNGHHNFVLASVSGLAHSCKYNLHFVKRTAGLFKVLFVVLR